MGIPRYEIQEKGITMMHDIMGFSGRVMSIVLVLYEYRSVRVKLIPTLNACLFGLSPTVVYMFTT